MKAKTLMLVAVMATAALIVVPAIALSGSTATRTSQAAAAPHVAAKSLVPVLSRPDADRPAQASPPVQAKPLDPEGIQRLIDDTNGAAQVSLNPATGAVRFVHLPADRLGELSRLVGANQPLAAQSAEFFKQYGSIFGIQDADAELKLVETSQDQLGATRLKYQQLYKGVPVFAGVVHVHFNRNNQMTAVNGTFIPGIALDTQPDVSADRATQIAVSTVGSLGASASQPRLYVYRQGLAQGVLGLNYLVYEVEVKNGVSVRDFIYVDAHSGKVVDRIVGINDALIRRVYSGTYTTTALVWQEGDAFPFAGTFYTDVNNIILGSGEAYSMFLRGFGRDSYNGAGAAMEIVNNAPIQCPNANWNGITTNYCNGVTSDDVVAHEWGHAYTEYTHNLFYLWQPGALNEAYSDIWGEVVDQINGRGTDSPLGLRAANACSIYTPSSPSLVVNSPAGIAGSYPAGPAQFGPPLTGAGITGTVVLANDGVGTGVPPSPAPTDACTALTNGAAISGTIALVDRGTCSFKTKVRNAQNAGAIGVIVANHVTGGDGLLTMADDPTITQTITIPSLFIGYSNGNLIKSQLGTGVNATLRLGVPGATENSYRWLIGEDATAFGGAIRDMWNPTCYFDPGKVSDTLYQCSTSDQGGVHTNSGVPNHAFALLMDGGTFNSQTITGIGMTKAAHIYWRAQAVYQVPASDFADHADALETSCTDLVTAGTNLNSLTTGLPSGQVVTTTDCLQVTKAISATELRVEPAQCNFQPLLDLTSPALCDAGRARTVYTNTLDISTAGWTVTHTDVFSATNLNWVLDPSLPNGRPGSAFFAYGGPDGACTGGLGDLSRVMFLRSPVITLPVTAFSTTTRVAFDHYVATEADYDGGNLKIRVNGGAWQPVDVADIEFNPYNTTLVDPSGNTNPLAGEDAYSGSDGGQVTGSWARTLVNLAPYADPGDTVQFSFEFGADGCGGLEGWYVDDVQLYYCSLDQYMPVIRKNSP